MSWQVMDTNADIDLKVVGQIVSATSLIYVFPSEETIGNFLVPLLTGAPGCQAVSLCFRKLAGPIGDVRGKTCQRCVQRLSQQMQTDQYVCGLAEQDHVRAYPLETVVRTYGYLILTVDRESDYVKYEPFIQNLCNALAIILENRWQQEALQASKVNLEQQVEERTAELNRFFSASLDLLCIADADAYFRRLNPEWEKTLGYSLAYLTGRRFWDFVHPDDLEATRAVMTQLAANATLLNFENRYRCKNGSYRWIEWRALPVGHLIYAAARDVTKRRRMEDALRKSDERYRSLISTMLNGFSYCRMVFDDQQRPVDFIYLAVNPAFEHLTGLRNVTGKPVTEVIADIKESNPELFEIYGRVVLTGQPEKFEIHLAPLTRWLVVSAAWAGEGCFAAIFDNITERKQAELALEKNESRLRAIMANMGEGLVVQSADGAITDCNPSAESILGLSRDEIMGKTSVDPSWLAVLENGRPFEGEEHPAMVSLRTGQPCQNVTMGLRLPDGAQKWINVNAQPIFNHGEDRPASVVTTFADITSLKLTEAALRTAAVYARSLLEASLDPLVTISIEGKITDVNDASAQVTGVPRERLIGTDFSDYFTEPAQARAGYQQVFAEGFVRDYPLAIRHISGRVTDVLYNATVYRDAHGQVLGVFAAARDITAHKRAQEALYASEERFRAFYELGLVGLAVTSPDKGWMHINERLCQMLEYGEDELRLMTWAQLTHPDDLAADLAQFQQMTNGHIEGYEVEKRFIARSGRTFPARLVVRCVRNPDRSVNYIVAMVDDITMRKQAEAALQASAYYARSLIEASLDPLVTINVEGKITDVNEASVQTTGVPREQLIGTDFSDYFTEPAQARVGYQQVFAEGFVRDYPLAIRHISGRVTDVLYNATVYRDAHGQVLGVFAAARDITARKRAEAEQARLQALNQQFQLQKSESLRRMAGAVAHNLNNQIQTVMMGLEMAIEDQPQNAVPDTNLTEALQSARKAAGIGDQMLTYLGQTHVEHETLDLSETCQRNLPMLTAVMPKTVVLKTDLPAPGPVIHANASQIQQVLTHLLTNAWEASRDRSGEIRLTVKPVATADIPAVNRFPVDWQPQALAYACLEVADAGCGIAAADMEKLFDPYYSSKFTGRGLGLAVVLGIVREHGGGITVASQPDQGSVFRVFLPVPTVAALQPPAPVVSAPKKAGRDTVLVVDDDECLRTFVVLALQRKDYTVFSAVDGVEAVELFLRHRDEIGCVLCDLTMPRMNGWETLTALRQLAPGIPVIISSGYSKAEVMAGHHPELPQAFLGKPYELKELYNIINEWRWQKPAQ